MGRSKLTWAAAIVFLILLFRDPAGTGHVLQQAWHQMGVFIDSL